MAATILLTEDLPSYGVLAAARALRVAGFVPLAAVTADGGYCSRSAAIGGVVVVPDPTTDAEAFAGALADAARERGAAAILPGTETALRVLAASKALFDTAVRLGTCSPDVVDRATDKSQLAALAVAAGTAVPPTTVVNRDGVAPALRELGLPAVVKPLNRALLEDAPGVARKVDAGADLATFSASLPEGRWLVQPYLEGTLYGIGGVAWDGDVLCAVHQVAHRIIPPDCGGTAFGETVAADVGLEQIVARLVGEVGWTGIFQAQFIRAGSGDYLIDFNPRIYGTLGLAVAAGLNLPAIWVERLLGQHPRFDGYAAGVRFRSEEKDGFAAVAALRRRDWATVADVARPRRRTTHAAFAARDPLPLLTSVVKVRRAGRALRAFGGAKEAR